jgi:beta-N-acetylhexosaminidase
MRGSGAELGKIERRGKIAPNLFHVEVGVRFADVGQTLMAGFEGTTVGDQVRELLKFGVGGFILFRRNLESAAQTAELIAEIRALARRRILFAIDEEGGRVQRLRQFATVWPAARLVGAAGDPGLATDFGAALGAELHALGFDLDFAPVVDVDSNPENPVIGDRSFGRKPEDVAKFAAAFIAGLQGAGVAACAKHFPGHGDTLEDSHDALPVVRHDRARLDCIELPPFRAAAAAGVATMMTAHVIVEALDSGIPATMSPRVVSLLRNEIGFDGVVFSDDLEMHAIAGHFALGEAAVRAATAGCDMLLVCLEIDRQEKALRGLFDARAAGRLTADRLSQMNRRRESLMAAYSAPGRGDLARVGCAAHTELANRIDRLGRAGLTEEDAGSKQT